MNADPSLDDFAAELRRDLAPAAPSSRLARGVAAGLSRPAATPPLAAQRWLARWPERFGNARLAWAGAAALLAGVALAIGAFGPDSPTRSRTAAPPAAVAQTRADPGTGPAVAASGADRFQASEESSATREDGPLVLRSRREYVDTLRWRDRRTGAQLEVRYPRAEFVFASAEAF